VVWGKETKLENRRMKQCGGENRHMLRWLNVPHGYCFGKTHELRRCRRNGKPFVNRCVQRVEG